MRRRRLAAAAVFSIVMLAALAMIVYTEQANASATINVWVLTRDVTAGMPYSAQDVQEVQIKAQSNDYNFEAQGPADYHARYRRAMSARDILRADDLVAARTTAEVALTVQNPPPLSSGDQVDLYAAVGSGAQALIGRAITVETVTGGTLTVLVPAQDEASWVAIGSSSVALHAAKTVTGPTGDTPPLGPDDAIHILCGSSCSAITPPSPSP